MVTIVCKGGLLTSYVFVSYLYTYYNFVFSFRSSKLNTLVTKLHEFLGNSPDDESIDSQDISNGEDK